MKLLVIRHAIAEDREAFAKGGDPDSERPLTDFGRRRMRRNVKGLLRATERPDVLATSPFARAAETARIVADALGLTSIEVLDALTPEHHPRDLEVWLGRQNEEATIAVVGHEPHLGRLITWFVSGGEDPRVELKKGGVALLEFDHRPAAGKAMLRWLLTPAHLRAIGD